MGFNMKPCQNNELCIIAFIYGYQYQGWIPVYLFSILKNYPDYHVRIYLDGTLSLSVKKNLSLLNGYGGCYEIIERDFLKEKKLSNFENRSLRWLILDKELEKFKYIYIGDIDIYICKERIGLLEQHIQHMELLKLPYSNVPRLTLMDYLKHRDSKTDHLFRLTGLHFFLTDTYFKKTNRWRERFLDLILHNYRKYNILKLAESYFIKKYITTDDERMLYCIVRCSRLGMPNCSYQIDEKSKKCFRPTHGVHFAVGRESKAYREMKVKYQWFDEEKEHFKNFVEDYNSYEILQKLFQSNQYILNLLSETCNFYGYKLCLTQIVESAI